MSKLCRQVSIETPSPRMKDCVFNFEVPIPDVPSLGARIQVVYAGACYRIRPRSSSASSVSSATSTHSVEDNLYTVPSYHGIRDGALFPGYEVAGVVDKLGSDVAENDQIFIGQRVVLYPYDDIPHGYAEYIVVPDLKYLVPVPECLLLSIACMLPTGALLAKNAIVAAQECVEELVKERSEDQDFKILIVGTGGLAMWAIKIAQRQFSWSDYKERVRITVATLNDEGFMFAQELTNITVVQWNEELYEKQLIERTKDACNGLVDIVIDFGTTSRSLHRSLQCLNVNGVVLINEDVAERLLPKFSRLAGERQQKIVPVGKGTIEDLNQLVIDVSSGTIMPPPFKEFAVEEASTVVQKLIDSAIPGRAILRFRDVL